VIDYRAIAEKWLQETPEGGRVLDALGRMRTALGVEAGGNSDQARVAAQTEALAAGRELDALTGERDLRRRRMLAHARGLPKGAKADAADFDRFATELTNSPSGKVMARLALGRYLQDSAGDLGERIAGIFAMDLMQTSGGRDGLVTGTIKSAGVDPESGAALPPRQKTVDAAGYTLGAEHGGGRAPHALWKRAARAYNDEAARQRMSGYNHVKNVTANTVRDWVTRNVDLAPGSPKAGDLFNEAKSDGAAARLQPDPSRLLPV
jgi:hypothetical protein